MKCLRGVLWLIIFPLFLIEKTGSFPDESNPLLPGRRPGKFLYNGYDPETEELSAVLCPSPQHGGRADIHGHRLSWHNTGTRRAAICDPGHLRMTVPT